MFKKPYVVNHAHTHAHTHTHRRYAKYTYVNHGSMNEWNRMERSQHILFTGIWHLFTGIKDNLDSERGNPLPPHGLLFQLAARVLLYAPSHRQDITYHSLCYTSRGVLAGTRNSSMDPPCRIDPTTIAPLTNALTTELHLAPDEWIVQWVDGSMGGWIHGDWVLIVNRSHMITDVD